jgi:hypothetical protein
MTGPTRQQLEEYDAKVLGVIAEHGLFLQGVFGTKDDPGPNFIYTVGLAKHGKPELIEYCLPWEVGHSIMNEIGFRILRGEIELHPGDTIHQLVETFPVKVVAVRDSWQQLTMANHLFGSPDGVLPALQLVFPDMNGVFPWEPGCTFDGQPLLGEYVDSGTEIILTEEEEQ